jgi:hypothetical protein
MYILAAWFSGIAMLIWFERRGARVVHSTVAAVRADGVEKL